MTTPAGRILIIQNGQTNPSIVARHGNYPDWFISKLSPHGYDLRVLPAFDGTPLPST